MYWWYIHQVSWGWKWQNLTPACQNGILCFVEWTKWKAGVKRTCTKPESPMVLPLGVEEQPVPWGPSWAVTATMGWWVHWWWFSSKKPLALALTMPSTYMSVLEVIMGPSGLLILFSVCSRGEGLFPEGPSCIIKMISQAEGPPTRREVSGAHLTTVLSFLRWEWVQFPP